MLSYLSMMGDLFQVSRWGSPEIPDLFEMKSPQLLLGIWARALEKVEA